MPFPWRSHGFPTLFSTVTWCSILEVARLYTCFIRPKVWVSSSPGTFLYWCPGAFQRGARSFRGNRYRFLWAQVMFLPCSCNYWKITVYRIHVSCQLLKFRGFFNLMQPWTFIRIPHLYFCKARNACISSVPFTDSGTLPCLVPTLSSTAIFFLSRSLIVFLI